MKLAVALALALSSSVAAQQHYQKVNYVRGAKSQTRPVLTASLSSDADDAACFSVTERGDCSANALCSWCTAGAVSDACYPASRVGDLPAGVFACGGNSVSVGAAAPASSVSAGTAKKNESSEPKWMNTKKSQTFNLKQGVTLTMSSGEIDPEFCDSGSKGLAGYMNVKGSQFDSDSDKQLFFWMHEKRSTSQVPADNVLLQTGWNWPWSDSTPEQKTTPAHKNKPAVPNTPAALADEDTPLIIWLTGGPGCSSSLALLAENGPCSVNDDGASTKINPYSWTESAHVLWLDQPADVGYSYGQGNDTNEQMISEDAYYFLQAFFQSDEGSKYKNQPLYIVGESYGGHYAPAIAHRISRGNKDLKDGLLALNLKGLAVGNGLTDPEEQYKHYADYAYDKNGHGVEIINESTYNMMKTAEPICTAGIHKCNDGGDGMLNKFVCQAAFFGCNTAFTTPYRLTGKNPYDITKDCGLNPLCYDFSHIEKFMNSDATKKALHVDSHNPTWRTCNMGINMSFHVDWMKNFAPKVADLVNDGIPALIYAGDLDFVCNYLGNRAWTLKLDWQHKAEFNAAAEKDWNSGGGLVRTANGLTFLQVYDAGHMVPSDQPEHALAMITQFIQGKPF